MKEREIFEAALAIDDEVQRNAFLSDACQGNPEMKKRVAGAVAAHRQLGSFLERPAADFDATADLPGLEQPGQMIGPYKLRERIGAGGMGVIWAAEQKHPLRRRVALKLVKPGMDSEQILGRFDMEREALSLMDHPNIARVLDAGTTPQGRPYFVMELIHGIPITEYCDLHKASIRDRLKMFVQVCRAVQHAHQKGIIHRDIKPLNVLVTEKDGQPTPKIIDFGVAKALHQPLTDHSVYSGVFQAIGTMAYMSPEQAGLSSSDIDSRADIYGLGVLLYELLTGKTPFDKEELASAALDEACRIIREQDPPKPSFTISTMGERATAVSEVRGTDPTSLGRLVKGELDWIVMNTLEKDRNRRYESASNLIDDISRYLAGEPVSVSPPSRVYQFTRFCRRNKGKLTATVLVAATLLICTAVSTALAINLSIVNEQNETHLIALEEREEELTQKSDELRRKNLSLARSQESQAQISYSLAMMSAYMEWANANPVAVVRLLNEARSYLKTIRSEPGVEWNLLTNQVRRDFADDAGTTLAHTHPFVSIKFSPDSRWLAVPVRNSGIYLVDLSTYEQKQIDIPLTGSGDLSLPLSVTFSPTGNLLAFGVRMAPDMGRISIMDAKQETLQVINVDFEPWRLEFSSDGKQLEAGSAYPAPTVTERKTIVWTDGSRNPVADALSSAQSANNSPNEAFLRSRRAIDLHDRESGKFIRQILESVDVETRQISPDGTHMATISLQGRVKLWDLRKIRNSVTDAHPHWSIPLTATPDGQVIAMAYDLGSIKLWNPLNGQAHEIKDAHGGYVAGLSFSHDGRTLVSGGFDGRVKVWDPVTRTLIKQLGEVGGEVWGVAFSRDDRLVAAGGNQGTIHLWDLESGELIQTLDDPLKRTIRGMEFLPSGDRLLACNGSIQGTLTSWNIETKDAKILHECGDRVDSLQISPDQQWLAVSDRFGNVVIFSTSSWQPVWRRKVAGSYIAAVKFSNDSTRLFCAGPDGVTIYRQMGTDWRESGRLMSPKESFRQVLVMPNGEGLVTACTNGTVRYWPMTPPQ